MGHDGSEIWWPKLKKPFCFRGFHIQEMVDVCRFYGKSLTPIEICPRSGGPDKDDKAVWPLARSMERFYGILKSVDKALIIGQTHAIAYVNGLYIDPIDNVSSERTVLPIREIWVMGEWPCQLETGA